MHIGQSVHVGTINFMGEGIVMSVKNSKTFYRSSSMKALALISLLTSSTAFCQSHPGSTTPQQWADPGAIEKAKKEAVTQEQNRATNLSPTLPAPTGSAAAGASASTLQKPSTGVQSSTDVHGEHLSKTVRKPSEHKTAHLVRGHEAQASHAKFYGTTHDSVIGHKIAVSPGFAPAAGKMQMHAAKSASSLTTGVKVSHSVSESLPNRKEPLSPSTTAVEFDPIYGYSNMVSVAY